jgi:response regulator RpfG family c-di-GMP phosphodiesterase
MHDIGKVGIPDSVLLKPAKLDESEWEIMKTHSELGYNVLKNSDRPILKSASIIAREHHEKYDGSGYPRGLKGDEIDIFARITAIADVFDALGSDRYYKKSWSLDNILEFFVEQRGKHFEPKLIDIFIENLDKFLEIREKYRD